ncbi:MAG: DUF3256 family protein [Muribaculaceae bacterium]|nr:DUF3256 family protein [Muribaculaceae bacterium]
MRRIGVLITVIMALAFNAGAYDGVSKLFVEENGDLFNSITVPTRYELINNFGRADKTELYNDLRTEETRILALTDEYMKIATSSAQTVELKLLHKSKRDTVIAVIETVAVPYKDSRLTFYDTKWNKLDASKFIKMPTFDDFILPSMPKDLRNNLVNSMMMTMIELRFEGETLVAQCNANDFFMGDDLKTFQPYLVKKVVYTINKSSFKKK